MAIKRGPHIITDGLVFSVDAGSPRSYAGSGTGVTNLIGKQSGTLINGTGFSSANGGSWDFDGSNDYINFPDDTALNLQTLTMESWSKLDGTVNQSAFLFEKGSVNTQYSNFYNGSNNFYFRTKGLSTEDLVISPTTSYISLGAWVHIVCTYGSGTKTIYIDGVQKAQQTGLTGTISTNTQMYIGAYGRGVSYFTNGKIALSRVYNRSLTVDEVLHNYNAQKNRFS